MIRITLTILVHFSIGQMIPSFYRQVLDFSSAHESVLNTEISQTANSLDKSAPRSGGILEILKQRQHKRELIAMVDDMAHGPAFTTGGTRQRSTSKNRVSRLRLEETVGADSVFS